METVVARRVTDPHVVMMVVGDATNDTRVKREAVALARAGLRVTLLAVSSTGDATITPLESAVLVRVPVGTTVRSGVLSQREQRRTWRPVPLAVARAQARELLEIRDSAREPATRPPTRSERLRRSVRDRMVAIGGEVDERLTGWWQAYDERVARIPWGATWRSTLDGSLDDAELAFGPLVDDLAPDVIHAHDMHLLGVAARAVERARRQSRTVHLVYDAHEFVPGLAVVGRQTRRSIAAWADLEAEFAGHADRVVTVSPAIASALADRFGLGRVPDVVLNTPVQSSPGRAGTARSLRQDCGIGSDVPLLVYSGIITAVRGVDTAADALEHLPGVHLAIVCVPRTDLPQVHELRAVLADRGLTERVHFVDPVGPGEVVDYLSSADVGLIPMRDTFANHQLTLPNKIFEYVGAGIPTVATDVRSLGGVVRERGVGEVFRSGDARDLARAVRAVLEDVPRYREAIRRVQASGDFSWARQEQVLRSVYADLLGRPVRELPGLAPARLDERAAPRRPGQAVALAIGPLNTGGWATAWARAVEAHLPGVRAESMMLGRQRGDPAADVAVTRTTYRRDLAWRTQRVHDLLGGFTHVLAEDAQPLAGGVQDGTFLAEVQALTDGGFEVGVVFHAGVGLAEPGREDEIASVVGDLTGMGVRLFATDAVLAAALPGARRLPEVDERSTPQESRAAAVALAPFLGTEPIPWPS